MSVVTSLRLWLVGWVLLAMMPGDAFAQSEASGSPASGKIVVTGSVTLANLITLWAEEFRERNPAVTVTVADPGSAGGVEALLNGSANAVLTSMPLNQQQKNRFIDRFGYSPGYAAVAKDGVAVYVNRLNPLRKIDIRQLDAIYSATRRCGARKAIKTWHDAGVQGSLEEAMITPLGLTAGTGAYLMFKHVVLCDGDFRTGFQAVAGPAALQVALADDVAAIGFSSSALRSAEIRALALARREKEAAFLPAAKTIQNGQYPLTRTLGILLNIPPGRNAAPGVQAFIDYVRSAAGQATAAKAGYVPLL